MHLLVCRQSNLSSSTQLDFWHFSFAMSRPNFVTKEVIDKLAQERKAAEFAERTRQFKTGLNGWWQNNALPALTNPRSFTEDGYCDVLAPDTAIRLFGSDALERAINERVLETSAPYTVKIGNSSTGLFIIRFTCVK